jgi:VCBS repeat-containing protein
VLQSPLSPGEPYTTEVTVSHIDGKQGVVTLEATGTDKDAREVFGGEFRVRLPNYRAAF